MLEDCDEENSSDDFSLDGTRPAVLWPANSSEGIKK
jgi:hypothetical protein